jgi:hypothetical protein
MRLLHLLPVLALLLPLAGAAQQAPGNFVRRDAQGRVTERWEVQRGGGYVIKDSRGRRMGTAERAPNGSTILRDAQGRRTGSLTPLP